MGLIARILCRIGDILSGYYGQSGMAFFGSGVNTDITDAPMWQFGLYGDLIESVYRALLLLPFMVTNIWVTVNELFVSVLYIYLVTKKVIKGQERD